MSTGFPLFGMFILKIHLNMTFERVERLAIDWSDSFHQDIAKVGWFFKSWLQPDHKSCLPLPVCISILYHCTALYQSCAFIAFWTILLNLGLFHNNLLKKRCESPRTMDRSLFWLNKLLKALINRFVDIFSRAYFFKMITGTRFVFIIRGNLKIPWTKPLRYSWLPCQYGLI